MVTTVSCQNCGARVSAEYARVFGNDADELHACSNCSTQRAVARGAAVDAGRDGTLLVHHPDTDEPVEALMETDRTASNATGRYRLEELPPSTAESAATRPGRPDGTDEAFEALVAE